MEPNEISNGVDNVNVFSIRGAARFADMGEAQVGQLVRKGRFGDAAKKIDGKWTITKEGIEAYQATKGQRAGGALKYTVYLTTEQAAQLTEAGYELSRPKQGAKKEA